MTEKRKTRTAGITIRRFAPNEGALPQDYDPGDFILTHGKTFFSRLIRRGQQLRYFGPDRKYTWWNHAAMIVSPDGHLIEALGTGVQRSHLDKYKPTEYHLVRLGTLAQAIDRRQVVDFADWCLGEEYGWFTILSIALSLPFGGRFNFGFDGQAICSGLVARALERTDAIFDKSPSHIMPADLAKYFLVQPPSKGSDKGKIL